MGQYKFVKINYPISFKDNFDDLNPLIKYIEPFKTLYEADKTKYSDSMISVYLFCDPSYENKIYRLQIDQKKSAILAYNPDFNFNDPLIAECLLAYPEHCLTPAAKAFRIEEESLVKRTKFIDEAEYTFPEVVKDKNGAIVYVAGRPMQTPGTAKDIDAMRKLTLDIYKKYDQVRKMFEEEQNELRLFGGGRETALEKNQLVIIEDED